jgi:hypothetical protein
MAGKWLLVAVVAIFFHGCGLDFREPKYLVLVDTYPSLNQTDCDPWGPYKMLFNQSVGMVSNDNRTSNFIAFWSVSAETLIIHRAAELPGYDERCTLSIDMLLREDGETDFVRSQFVFTTGRGEREDNGSFNYPDTVMTGKTYGEIENSSATFDLDYFFVLFPASDSSVRLDVQLLNSKSIYLSTNYAPVRSSLLSKETAVAFEVYKQDSSYMIIRQVGSAKDTSITSGNGFLLRFGTEDISGSGYRLPAGARYAITTNIQKR